MLEFLCRYGISGEICVFWAEFQPHQLLNRATRRVEGHGGREREYLVWCGLPFATALDCRNGTEIIACSLARFQVIISIFSLYIVAVAQGGHKSCAQAFDADRFDGRDSKECKDKSSFFNWWYFGVVGGSAAVHIFLNYIQDNLN
ncbi:hypothetical protein Vadar_000413 [Vaccinium darrowii]|uniref:Uncharacterized protein n=1 Tax=Vaccinium darrowii TaxID=229202 RepID=A0ACB7WWP7_9ERIC|nr:hypothetical protein Vadar_000413 [Vaccinium darrowii]